ncbi:hypothetical protein GOV05_03085 [Candidatus Woesearchaeota archaeon]|nr:hypothetical protein [Candidatus Woesearchaeota archaeon]
MDVDKLEKSVWKTRYEDGVAELMIGFTFIVAILLQAFSTMIDPYRYYFYPLLLLPALIGVLITRYVINPRSGTIKFSKKRRKRFSLYAIILTITIILQVIITATGNLPFKSLGVGTLVLLITLSIAYVLDYDRMYFYSILITASFYLDQYIIKTTGVIEKGALAWIGVPIVMISVGTYLLTKFLKTHPKEDK